MNFWTIFKRDFSTYFKSAIGYIFIIVFLFVSVLFFQMLSFFLMSSATMDNFFGMLPWVLCILIPAITMRVWAEERKENTFEMLMTFPIKASHLVLGKYLSSLMFFLVCLGCTITVPIMLYSLGSPDTGVLISSYIGAILLAGMFVALGCFISALCKDQIVAFVVSLLTTVIFYLLGSSFTAAKLDDAHEGLGSALRSLVGIEGHYQSFVRGVIEVGDVLFFGVWTAIFIVLTGIYFDQRNKQKNALTFPAFIAICVIIGALFNGAIHEKSLMRIDMTENKTYTVSESSKKILGRLKDSVKIKYYVSPTSDMPTELKTMERDVLAKISELRLASGGKIEFRAVHMRTSDLIEGIKSDKAEEDKTDADKTLEERLIQKGVQPFSVQALRNDQVVSKMVYSSMSIGYLDKKEEIIPHIVPQNLNEMEYQLVNVITKLTREKPPVVALVAPKGDFPPELLMRMRMMGQQVPQQEDPFSGVEQILRHEKYDVRRVELTQTSTLPDEYDLLLVLNPRGLNERQRWEINRAIYSGKPTFMAVQQANWNYRQSGRGYSVTRQAENPGMNELLKHYGFEVSESTLMDTNHVPLNIGGGGGLAALFSQPLKLPMHIQVLPDSFNKDLALSSRLNPFLYLWGSAITTDDKKLSENSLNSTSFVYSSDKAWEVPSSRPLEQSDLQAPAKLSQYPLGIVVKGQFPDAFKDKERPAWPKAQPMPGQPPQPDTPDPEASPVAAAPGKVILIGGAQMFRRNFLDQSSAGFLLNVVDGLAYGDELLEIRGKKPISRVFSRPDKNTRIFWSVINPWLICILIGLIGLIYWFSRKSARDAYTRSNNA